MGTEAPDAPQGYLSDDAHKATESIRAALLFLSSFAPLFALLAIRFDPWSLRLGCAILSAVGLVAGLYYLFVFVGSSGGTWTIAKVDDRGAEVAGYLATYILPFVTVSQPRPQDVVAYAIFIALAGLIYVRSSMIQINPLFYIAGRTVTYVELEDGWSGYLVAKATPYTGRPVAASRLTSRVMIA